MRSRFLAAVAATFALCAGASPATAQELFLKRALPPGAQPPCAVAGVPEAPPPAADEEARSEAGRLAAEASQAAILGDRARARELLEEAAALDPTSPGVAYRLARVLEDSGAGPDALVHFCRVLALEPEGSDAPDVRRRIERLSPALEGGLPDAARSAFLEGVAHFDAREFDAAARQFSRALVEYPDWDQAHFNRGLANLELGREAAAIADLERYLELRPQATDRDAVASRLGARAPAASDLPRPAPARARHSAGTALVSGLVLPGMGHVYSDRPGRGALIFLAAGGSVAAGILYTDVEIECRLFPAPAVCPSEEIADRRETRPYLTHGIAAAGAITLLGAVHAALTVRSRNRRAAAGLAVALPGSARGPEAVHLSLEPFVRPDGAGVRAAVRIPVP